MISYIHRTEFNATFGSGNWRKLQIYGPYDGLMFNEYYYQMCDTIYTEPSPAAKQAYEKEKMWHQLQKTKRTNLEVLRDLTVVAEEIEADKERKRQKALNKYIKRNKSSETKAE